MPLSERFRWPRQPNPNFMAGVPELMILRLLQDHEMYGYQIVQAIRTETADIVVFGEGIVYTVLHALERDGALKTTPQDGRWPQPHLLLGHGHRSAALSGSGRNLDDAERRDSIGHQGETAMSLPFEAVREQLLRAGVTPRYANRYVMELREHLTDLIESLRTSNPDDAQRSMARALAMMGKDADLVQATLERGAPRSLAARAPWATFVLVPVALWMVVLCAGIVSLMHLLWPVRGLTPRRNAG